MRYNNDSGSLGGVILFIILLGFLAFFWLMFGPLFDQSIGLHNNLTTSGMYVSPERQDAMDLIVGTYVALPIIGFAALVFILVIIVIRGRNQVI